MTDERSGPPSLLQRRFRVPALAMIALVTLGALENRATGTVLPVLADDLGGLTWFGAATTGPGLTFVIAVVLAGAWTDRRGPGPAIFVGVGLFLAGQLVIATAPSMIIVVAGRLLSGVAEGLFNIGVTVLTVTTIPEALRPRMVSLLAMAWILPSVLGPQLAGWIAEVAGWRWVFLLGGVLAVPVLIALTGVIRRAQRAMGDRAATGPGLGTLPYAVAVAGTMGAAAALAPLATRGGTVLIIGAIALALLVAIGIGCARPLLPAGTLALRRGLGATIALGGLLSAAYSVGGAFLPLMLIEIAHFSPATAGLSMTVTGLFWAVGFWVQGSPLVQRRTSVTGRVGLGLAAVGTGLIILATAAAGLIIPAVGLVGWAVASIGIGLSSASLSVHRFALAADAEQGRVAAGNSLLGSAAISAGTVAVGYGIAATAPHPPAGLFATVFVTAGLLAITGAALAGRIRSQAPARVPSGGGPTGARA